MANFERLESLPHVVLQREPELFEIRPRNAFPPRVVERSDRRQHAGRLKKETVASATKIERLRAQFGVDPHRLLVLRLEVLDVNQRETLERLNVSVVEELKEKREGRTVYRLLVQFSDEQSLATFTAEYDRYAEETETGTALPHGKRRDLFDALDSVSTVIVDERKGRRLQREGVPEKEPFYLDVDIWNPGSVDDYSDLIASFRKFIQSRGGRIVRDPLRIPCMVLVKVEGNLQLLKDLLQLDFVSLVDLPPIPSPEDSFDLQQQIQVPDTFSPLPADGPLACVVDSGVVAGHPLLRGVVVAEEDFGSGENTPVDRNGHGSQVGGLVVYGDIAQRIPGNEWEPRVGLCSAKVLRNEPIFGETRFPDDQRVEDQLKQAIEYFHSEHNCRVFNLSIGHLDKLYEGGRQLPWAELLDELVRALDIVIVVSAGNVPDPGIPAAMNSDQFQKEVAQNLHQPRHRLIDPSTAALCVSVGAIARRDDPSRPTLGNQLAAASTQGCPSVFTRCGPGVAGAVKPEVVAPGGNFAVDSVAGSPIWRRNDPQLGEPTLNHNFTSGRPLHAVCGTSLAAAHVTHIAARMEAALRNQFGSKPSQNLVRALLVNSARVNNSVENYFDSQAEVLNTVGYGQPSVEYCRSSSNRITLVTEDTLEYRTFHVYSLVVPEEFLKESGKRSISVSLAYDPPTRSSRQDYIATAMWLEIFGGLTTEQVNEYRSKYEGNGEVPTVPDRNKLPFKPGGQTIRMSTVQKRRWHSDRGTLFGRRRNQNGDASLHLFVGCQQRFPNPLGGNSQRYALVVTLEHESQNVDIYQQVRARVRTRQRIRVSA